jgi:hypothetical protein
MGGGFNGGFGPIPARPVLGEVLPVDFEPGSGTDRRGQGIVIFALMPHDDPGGWIDTLAGQDPGSIKERRGGRIN